LTEAAAGSPATAAASAPSIEVIEAPGPNPEREVWMQTARLEAGLTKAIFTVSAPPKDAPDDWAAERVRSAPERGISVVAVEAVESPGLAEALESTRAKGVGVLLIGEGAVGTPAKPFHRVVFGSAEEPIRRLAAAAKDEARVLKLPADGHALIVVATDELGPLGRELVTRLETELKAIGVREVATFRFPGNEVTGAELVLKRVESDPAVMMVFSLDRVGLTTVLGAADKLKEKREFVIAGAVSFEGISSVTRVLVRAAGLVDLKLPTMGRRVVRQAVALARGETVEPVVTIPREYYAKRTLSKEEQEQEAIRTKSAVPALQRRPR
jgi:ABC-type sugar transport system substrate-binding protein